MQQGQPSSTSSGATSTSHAGGTSPKRRGKRRSSAAKPIAILSTSPSKAATMATSTAGVSGPATAPNQNHNQNPNVAGGPLQCHFAMPDSDARLLVHAVAQYYPFCSSESRDAAGTRYTRVALKCPASVRLRNFPTLSLSAYLAAL